MAGGGQWSDTDGGYIITQSSPTSQTNNQTKPIQPNQPQTNLTLDISTPSLAQHHNPQNLIFSIICWNFIFVKLFKNLTTKTRNFLFLYFSLFTERKKKHLRSILGYILNIIFFYKLVLNFSIDKTTKLCLELELI